MHATILCVGEGHWHAWVQELVQESSSKIACGHPHLVPGHHLPILWPHQLHRRITPCQLHSLHHPSSGPHLHVQIRCCKRGTHSNPKHAWIHRTATLACIAYIFKSAMPDGNFWITYFLVSLSVFSNKFDQTKQKLNSLINLIIIKHIKLNKYMNI